MVTSGLFRLHHLRIAYASAREVDVHLRILCLSHPSHRGKATTALQLVDDVRAMTWRLLRPSMLNHDTTGCEHL